MEYITLKRARAEEHCTIGVLTIGKSAFATLEDTVREEKIKHVTAIPAGTYELKLRNRGGMTIRYKDRYPDMHKGMIWLQDVPGFSWVYIHVGNFPEDTDGCILVGMRAKQKYIQSSRAAYERIYPKIVKMINDKGCSIVVKGMNDDEEYDHGKS